MSKKKKPKIDYRYYDIPSGSPILALTGESWIRNYGNDVDSLHFHNHLEIGYCHYGKGIMQLGEEIVDYTGGVFTVIPKNFVHTTKSIIDGQCFWEYIYVDLSDFLKKFYRDNVRMAERIQSRIEKRAFLYSEANYTELSTMICYLLNIMRNQQEFYLEEAKGLTGSILVEIARLNKGKEEAAHEVQGGTLSPALDFIHENLDQPIRVEQLAELCHISETHFRRKFSESVHMTPVEYINRIRIKAACEELRKTNNSVSSIAEKTGFPTLSTFNRNFLSIMGVSPNQWRKNPDNYEQKLLEYDVKTREGW